MQTGIEQQTYMTVTVGSHYFSVSKMTPRARAMTLDFAQKFVSWKVEKLRGRFLRVKDKVYASAMKDRSVFRFHINALNEFKRYMFDMGMDTSLPFVKWVTRPMYTPVDAKLKFKAGVSPREDQIPYIEYFLSEKPVAKLAELQTGSGKAAPLHTKIRIPGGWSTMGEMRIGTKIIAPDGTVTQVTGVYPQGLKDIYRITFDDGRSTECCGEHLWKVYYINTSVRRRWKVVNTLEIIRLISMPNPRVYIQLIQPEDWSDVEVPIDPYLLGVFLGDGTSANGTVSIVAPDAYIADEIKRLLPADCNVRKAKDTEKTLKCPVYFVRGNTYGYAQNSFINSLRKFGLFKLLSYDKFVPEIYKEGSLQQRLAIIQGLLDTDGTVSKPSGSISYCTTSKKLAEDMQYLVRSVGGMARIYTKIPHYSYKGEYKEGRLAYIVRIRHPEPSSLFRLPRKKELTNDDNQYADILKLRVSKVEPIGKKEAQCISVAHPDHLYITDDFIVTHNTFVSLWALEKIGKRFAVVIKPMYMDKWVSDVTGAYEGIEDRVLHIQGNKAIATVVQLAKDGELDADVFIISNATYRAWISMYEDEPEKAIDFYGCAPDEFFEIIGVGCRLIDETHQDFHFCFKLDTYTHIPTSFSLSATLFHKDPFIEKMYSLAFPKETRKAPPPLKKYINSYAVHFRYRIPGLIRSTEMGGTMYSHNAVEDSIMKHQQIKNGYYALVDRILKEGYLNDYKPGEKAIIYASSIKMCTDLTNWLAAKYPDKIVKRYVEDDPYENVIESDIRVTTNGSAGAALDIPGLKTNILTTAIQSIQANVQILGRLRDRKEAGPTRFYFLVADNHDKQMAYYQDKKKMLRERAATFSDIYTNYTL